ncbi:MAG: hypothetical protein WAN66_07525, partial [Limnoraphis robusta]
MPRKLTHYLSVLTENINPLEYSYVELDLQLPNLSCDSFLSKVQKPKYVLDADISKCFDKINHQKLLAKLQTYPKLRQQIKAWLK